MTDFKNIKLIVADMDGTFLRSDKSMSQANLEAVKLLRANGIEFSFCTGRIATQTLVYCKELDQKMPILTSQGAVVWDSIENKPLEAVYMDNGEAIRIADFCRDNGYDNVVLTHGPVYCTPNSSRLWNYQRNNILAEKLNVQPMDLQVLTEDHGFMENIQISKMLIAEKDPIRFQKAQDFLNTLTTTGYTVSDFGLLDITVAGENKGQGVKRLSQITGIPLEQICVFGDYYNDLDMFHVAGISVAMGNSPEDIKAQADLIAPSNDEDGFAKMVQTFLN
ncbi:MAG: HAD family hydrolase [Clostridia bacterium]|nr:HAD family hydrolase [Clostridia bacterium]